MFWITLNQGFNSKHNWTTRYGRLKSEMDFRGSVLCSSHFKKFAFVFTFLCSLSCFLTYKTNIINVFFIHMHLLVSKQENRAYISITNNFLSCGQRNPKRYCIQKRMERYVVHYGIHPTFELNPYATDNSLWGVSNDSLYKKVT